MKKLGKTTVWLKELRIFFFFQISIKKQKRRQYFRQYYLKKKEDPEFLLKRKMRNEKYRISGKRKIYDAKHNPIKNPINNPIYNKKRKSINDEYALERAKALTAVEDIGQILEGEELTTVVNGIVERIGLGLANKKLNTLLFSLS